MKTYLLVNIEQTHSNHNAVDLYRLSWLDTETATLYETTTDESYRNHDRWQEIIKLNQLGFYTGLRRTKRKTLDGTPVISADSRPRLFNPQSKEQVVALFTDTFFSPKNTFTRIFQ
jgi:hypothetical protein